MTPAPTPLLTPRNLTVWGVAVIASLWLALTAAGAVTQESSPRAALMLFPQNGFAYQNRALVGSVGKTDTIADLHVGPQQIEDARAALRREPLASTALTLIGIANAGEGRGQAAVNIVAAAHRMDKRQLIANAWLINHYGTQPGDHSHEVLGLLDEALKIRPTLVDQYMPAFARALVNPETVPVFQRLLLGKPSWEVNFWAAVASNDAALPNAEVLRSRLLARGEKPGAVDSSLMEAFIRTRRMDLALSYAKSLPPLPSDRDNLLHNSSFGATPQMPPLDWQLTNDGRMTAAIDEGSGTLEVNAIAGSGGVVARQLIALPPGQYQLLLKLGRPDFTRGSDLRVGIHCAESDDQSIPQLVEKADGDLDRSFTIANDSRCRFYWVDLVFSALDSSGPASTSVADVKIIRSRAVQDTEPPAEKTDGKAPE